MAMRGSSVTFGLFKPNIAIDAAGRVLALKQVDWNALADIVNQTAELPKTGRSSPWRRKKCDERHPSCSRCDRTRSHCVWPPKPASGFFLDIHELSNIAPLDLGINDSTYGIGSAMSLSEPYSHLDKSHSTDPILWEFSALANYTSTGALFSSSSAIGSLGEPMMGASYYVKPNLDDTKILATRMWEYAQDFGPQIIWPPEGLESCDELDPEGAITTFRQSVTALTQRVSPEPLFHDVCYFYSVFLTRIFYDYALIPGSLIKWIYQRFNTSSTSKHAMLATAALFRSDYERSKMTASLRACAKELYSLAIRHLTHDLEDTHLSPREKLTGLVEIMNFEYHSGRLSDYYSHGALALPLVKAVLGKDNLDLLSIRGIDMFDVNFWVWCDILDSMATSRPTRLKYETDLDRAAQPGTEESGACEDKGVEWIYGCPNIVAVLLARTSSLRHAKISEEEKQFQGGELEQLLRNWQLRPLGARDPLLRVTRVGAQEVWRHAGILYVHHALLNSNSTNPLVKESVKNIIKIASTLKPGGTPDSFLAVPYFIAGFYAITEKDRYTLRSRLVSSGNGCFLRNLASNLGELWKETDSTGRLTSWSEKQPPRIAF
ncbi:unnamed protein product [Rhizoctonia solani]|uniref:Zn(2)-C6 fungal-type domain-containing protein n=1 Tax=Rhizoctonia solani TaxID=456999 RepID=A0A8H3E5U9_9AGAM|nr:unnamed protein product [Rhizoctonia solani]